MTARFVRLVTILSLCVPGAALAQTSPAPVQTPSPTPSPDPVAHAGSSRGVDLVRDVRGLLRMEHEPAA